MSVIMEEAAFLDYCYKNWRAKELAMIKPVGGMIILIWTMLQWVLWFVLRMNMPVAMAIFSPTVLNY